MRRPIVSQKGRFRKQFSNREAISLVQRIRGNENISVFETYFGVSRVQVPILKRNVTKTEYVLDNWRELPSAYRKQMLNKAIWEGVDYSAPKNIDLLVKELAGSFDDTKDEVEEKPKKKRGRPKKNAKAVIEDEKDSIEDMRYVSIKYRNEKGVHTDYMVYDIDTIDIILRLMKSVGVKK